jgi:benzoylformate decarboxylase
MTTIFGNPGSTEMAFLNDLPADFRYILGLHEGAVVAMADGYAQATGTPTLVNLHSAPGVGNAMGSIVNARANRSPLVITAGDQVRPMQVMEALLTNVRGTELVRPAVKWSGAAPRPQDTPGVLARAIHEAVSPPPGPVFVSQPLDDWDADVAVEETQYLSSRAVTAGSVLSADSVAAIAGRVSAAKAPLLVLGAAMDEAATWDAAVGFAERFGAAVMIAPTEGRWSFPGGHPNFRGVMSPAIALATQQMTGYDLVIVAGSPVFKYYPYLPGELLPAGTALIQLTDDAAAAARAPMGDAYLSDPSAALALITQAVPGPAADPLPAAAAPPPAPGADPLTAADVFSAVADCLPADGAVVNESPSNLSVMFRHWRPSRPRSYFFSGSGGLGFGTAATVGVQLGMPDRRVLGVLGDGSLHYSVQALYTAAREQVPATFLVLRNRQYGILKWFGLLENAPQVPGLDLPNLDAEQIAEGYGVSACTVADAESLREALTAGFEAPTPRLIQVDIDQATDVI